MYLRRALGNDERQTGPVDVGVEDADPQPVELAQHEGLKKNDILKRPYKRVWNFIPNVRRVFNFRVQGFGLILGFNSGTRFTVMLDFPFMKKFKKIKKNNNNKFLYVFFFKKKMKKYILKLKKIKKM